MLTNAVRPDPAGCYHYCSLCDNSARDRRTPPSTATRSSSTLTDAAPRLWGESTAREGARRRIVFRHIFLEEATFSVWSNETKNAFWAGIHILVM